MNIYYFYNANGSTVYFDKATKAAMHAQIIARECGGDVVIYKMEVVVTPENMLRMLNNQGGFAVSDAEFKRIKCDDIVAHNKRIAASIDALSEELAKLGA